MTPSSAALALALAPTATRVRATRVDVLAGSATDAGCRDGAGAQALFHLPQGVCQPDANTLLIADRKNNKIRSYNLTTGACVFSGVG